MVQIAILKRKLYRLRVSPYVFSGLLDDVVFPVFYLYSAGSQPCCVVPKLFPNLSQAGTKLTMLV